jgi:photosystem II stability/assembly factor-like uncharacterized protein
MKKNLLLAATLIVICVTASAQNIINPYVEHIDAPNSTITKIETDKQYTIVSFVNTASADNAWVILNKEIFIQTDANNQHYDFVKAEGIPVAPETRHTFEKAGDKISFKIYFKKLPATAKTIDIIERWSVVF